MGHSVSPVSSRHGSPKSVMSVTPLARGALSFSALGTEENVERAGMGRRWLRWMKSAGLRNWTIPCAILGATCVKWAIGLGPYSGFGEPPLHGDYEAQRHWMEITLHLPAHRWYTYDVEYWGLDYPPLTAYVSWLCGYAGSRIDPSWFALDASRGIETSGSKAFMRASVLVLDAAIYVPALVTYVREWYPHRSRTTQEMALLTLLFHPALLLIDFGHFQYNSIMLGLALHCLNHLHRGQDLMGAVFFVLSLCFKQMALYFSPAIFGYLLGRCFSLGSHGGLRLFHGLALTTMLSFAIMFAPFLRAPSDTLAALSRIFPFSRGLFEDKVANFWCASNVVFKWRSWLERPALVKLSTALTAFGFLPSLYGLVRGGMRIQANKDTPTPTLALLPYALYNTSLAFFLFSFQVHEKSILLPLLPLTLLMAGGQAGLWEWGVLVNNVAVFSMWPLLRREGLGLQYAAITLLWNLIIGYNPLAIRDVPTRILSLLSYITIVVLHVAERVLPPPARYPDLYALLNVLLCASVFALSWAWCARRQIEAGWALGAFGRSARVRSGVSSPVSPPSAAERAHAAEVLRPARPVKEYDTSVVRLRQRESRPSTPSISWDR